MTSDEAKRIDASGPCHHDVQWFRDYGERIRAEEREACAYIADQLYEQNKMTEDNIGASTRNAASLIAAAIRQRGKK